MRTIFELSQTTVPIAGTSSTFPVRRIYCIGRNYAAHAKEMGGDPTREPPFFFLKPRDAIQVCPEGQTVEHPYPPKTSNYHHEVEMVVALGKGGIDVPTDRALDLVYGYAVGLDMTRRDQQNLMREAKRPWEVGKSADFGAPIGLIHPVADVGHPDKGRIALAVNGQVRQAADLSEMIWSVAEQIAILSQHFALHPGDLIFSGTPENVGAVTRGDMMEASIEGLGAIRLKIV